MDYNDVFLQSVKDLKKDYLSGELKFETESDLQSHLFTYCIFNLKQNNFPKPLKIRTNFGMFSSRQKIDLVLGEDVTLEIKYEPDNSSIPKSRSPVVLSADVEKDFKKINEYSKNGIKYSYFLFLDEDGQHFRKWSDMNWEILKLGEKNVYFLLHQA